MCHRAADSLLRQSFDDWELVIAKNGGTSQLAEYEDALAGVLVDPRATLLVLPGKGLGYALNMACQEYLRGHDYFANLEDDDEWFPEYLRTMVRVAERTGADVVHCKQRQVPRHAQSNGNPMDSKAIRGHNWINFPMCLFRAELFDKVGGFCNEAGPATDWDWHLRCLKAGARYEFVDKVQVTHYWHGDNYCLQDKGGRAFIERRMKEGVYG